MTTKLDQLRAMRERGQGSVRAESRKRIASDRPAKAITNAMLNRAASAIPPKPRKKRRK